MNESKKEVLLPDYCYKETLKNNEHKNNELEKRPQTRVVIELVLGFDNLFGIFGFYGHYQFES
jgi:hypothetical protein